MADITEPLWLELSINSLNSLGNGIHCTMIDKAKLSLVTYFLLAAKEENGNCSMTQFTECIELHIDQSGRISLPKELQEILEPGIALIVETRHNGTIALRIQRLPAALVRKAQPPSQLQLIDKEGVLVVRGEVPADFDWDALLADSPDICRIRRSSCRANLRIVCEDSVKGQIGDATRFGDLV